jgi:hypothetical protein
MPSTGLIGDSKGGTKSQSCAQFSGLLQSNKLGKTKLLSRNIRSTFSTEEPFTVERFIPHKSAVTQSSGTQMNLCCDRMFLRMQVKGKVELSLQQAVEAHKVVSHRGFKSYCSDSLPRGRVYSNKHIVAYRLVSRQLSAWKWAGWVAITWESQHTREQQRDGVFSTRSIQVVFITRTVWELSAQLIGDKEKPKRLLWKGREVVVSWKSVCEEKS